MATFNINTAVFAGKYAFVTPDNAHLISLSATAPGTTLDIEPGNSNSPGLNQQFNLYGDLQNGFALQAPNWSYMEYNNGYVADKKRTDPGLSVFYLQAIDSATFYIIETVSGVDYYLNVNGAQLERVAKASTTPPATAVFQQSNITDSLANIKQQHSTLANPLTGVYLAGQDLRTIAFMETDVSFADLSGTRLDNANFNGATANGTIFDQANLSGWIANGLTFSNCSFVKANLQYAKLSQSVLRGCTLNLAQFNAPGATQTNFTNLQQADFTNASLVGCQLGNALVNSATFNGATLINTDFSSARGVEDHLDFRGAILIGANLTGHDLTQCQINADTNFMSAILKGCNFTGHDLTDVVFARAKMANTKLDNTTLNGAQMAFADLSFASISGGVSMIGANLSNAILEAAQLPGAQLGAKKTMASLPLTDGPTLDQSQVPADMHQPPLNVSNNAIVKVVQPGNRWTVTDGTTVYQVNNNGTLLLVQTTSAISNAAVLSNAYMPNANFKQANLYAVEMSGAHWYGGSANAQSADLGLANLSNANLSGMTFTQAQMQGASFDFSKLIGTQFIGTVLDPSADLKPTSFAFSSLQSTLFSQTNLFSANLTDAAFALPNGVPLFSVDPSLVATLNSKQVSVALQNAFTAAVYPLISAATIAVTTPGSQWTICNIDSTNNSQTGYGNFVLLLVNDQNGLSYIQVYGAAPLLILEVNAKGQQVQIPMDFGPTGLTLEQMNDSTTCPSGMKLKLLHNHLSYNDLMTAALPPSPPICANCWG